MILVVGATGVVGRMIAQGLLERGRGVRILVRPGADFQALVRAGADATEGDLKEPASLARACAGVDTIVTTASSGSRGGADTPQTVDLEGNRHLIDAARAAKVGQFIFVSTIAADPSSPVPLLQAKGRTEAYLRESGLTYTILAATSLMDITLALVVGGPALAGRPVTLVGEGRRRHSFVAARDLAAYAVAAAGHPAARNRRILVGGPEPVSMRDVVDAYARALGRPLEVRSIAPGELLPDLPPVPGLAEVVSQMAASLDMFDSPVDMAEAARTFGVRPTTLAEFVEDQLARLVRRPAV